MEKRVITTKEVSYDEKYDMITLGLNIFEISSLYATFARPEYGSEVLDCEFKFKNSSVRNITMNKQAYELLQLHWNKFKAKEAKRKEENKLQAIQERIASEQKHRFIGIRKEFWILYILIILGFVSNIYAVESNINRNIKMNYVYNVEDDTCDLIETLKGKVSQYDMDNPAFVGKVEQRPNELVFITEDERMYVFVETYNECLEYQKHFLEEMNKLAEEEYNKAKNDSEFKD